MYGPWETCSSGEEPIHYGGMPAPARPTPSHFWKVRGVSDAFENYVSEASTSRWKTRAKAVLSQAAGRTVLRWLAGQRAALHHVLMTIKRRYAPDTNFFLQFKPAEELSWGDLTGEQVDEVELIVLLEVAQELDGHKSSATGRRSKRVRQCGTAQAELAEHRSVRSLGMSISCADVLKSLRAVRQTGISRQLTNGSCKSWFAS